MTEPLALGRALLLALFLLALAALSLATACKISAPASLAAAWQAVRP